MPQRLGVPLFQRPYVWNRSEQWAPLWDDVLRVADRSSAGANPSHFLGAIVLQQVPNRPGGMQEWTVIDGQQRLTTLQLLLDAIHAQLMHLNSSLAAERLAALIENGAAFLE